MRPSEVESWSRPVDGNRERQRWEGDQVAFNDMAPDCMPRQERANISKPRSRLRLGSGVTTITNIIYKNHDISPNIAWPDRYRTQKMFFAIVLRFRKALSAIKRGNLWPLFSILGLWWVLRELMGWARWVTFGQKGSTMSVVAAGHSYIGAGVQFGCNLLLARYLGSKRFTAGQGWVQKQLPGQRSQVVALSSTNHFTPIGKDKSLVIRQQLDNRDTISTTKEDIARLHEMASAQGPIHGSGQPPANVATPPTHDPGESCHSDTGSSSSTRSKKAFHQNQKQRSTEKPLSSTGQGSASSHGGFVHGERFFPRIPKEDDFRFLGLTAFDGTNATQFLKRYDWVRRRLNIRDEDALEVLKGFTVSQSLSQQLELYTTSAPDWDTQRRYILQAYRDFDPAQLYTAEQQLAQILQRGEVRNANELLRTVFAYDKVLMDVGRRETQGVDEFWRCLLSFWIKCLFSDHKITKETVRAGKWPVLMAALERVCDEVRQEEIQDENIRLGYNGLISKERLRQIEMLRAMDHSSLQSFMPQPTYNYEIYPAYGRQEAHPGTLPALIPSDQQPAMPRPRVSALSNQGLQSPVLRGEGYLYQEAIDPPERAASPSRNVPASDQAKIDDFRQKLEKLSINNSATQKQIGGLKQAIYQMSKKQYYERGLRSQQILQHQQPDQAIIHLNNIVASAEAGEDIDPADVEAFVQEYEAAQVNDLKKDGTVRRCYGCAEEDYGAYECACLRSFMENGIIWYEDPAKTRFFLGNKDDVRDGLARPLDAVMVIRYRDTPNIGVAGYACGMLEHLAGNGITEPCIERYHRLLGKDSSFRGRAELGKNKLMWESTQQSSKGKGSWVRSIQLDRTKVPDLMLSGNYLPPHTAGQIHPAPHVYNVE